MTDLEMTKLCAEAMGVEFETEFDRWAFNPLHDDAQAMALVKKFRLMLDTYADNSWLVRDGWKSLIEARNADLNRAIVECVAKMQAAQA